MYTIRRFPRRKCYLPCYDLKTGIKTNKIHFLTFKSSQPLRMCGFGIYGPMTEKELDIQYGILLDDFCNPGNHKTILSINKRHITFNGHRNVVPLLFSEPVVIRRHETYVLFLNTDGYKTYRGVNGTRIVKDGHLKLMFDRNFDDTSETSVADGNFPELYFKHYGSHISNSGQQTKLE